MKPTAGKRITGIIMASLISLLSLTSLIPVMASAEEAAAPTTALVSTDGSSTYSSYIDQYADIPNATEAIHLPIQEATLSKGAVLQSVEGENSLVLPEDGLAEWTIQVPETALYVIKTRYCAIAGDGQTMELGFAIDGQNLFDGAGNVQFKRIWQDEGDMRQDFNGNDLPPLQKEVFRWQTAFFEDYATYFNGTYTMYIEAGQHNFSLFGVNESIALSELSLLGKKPLSSYAEVSASYAQEGYQDADTISLKYQAEKTYEKSDSVLVPVYDRSSAATEPNDPAKIRRNTIGQSRWSDPGMWISYEVEVPKDGLYKLACKVRQNTQIGMSALRDIYVDGEIPFAEMQGVIFPYSVGWQMTTISDGAGEPCLLYLKEGKHEIRFVATLDRWSDVLCKLDVVNKELNQLYRKIIMITGVFPDGYRDYKLDEAIPGMMDTMRSASDTLFQMAEKFDELNGGKSSQSTVLRNNAQQLDSFVKDPDSIPKRLSKYQSNISVMSEWLLSVKSQPLEMDYFILAGAEETLPDATPSFLKGLDFGVKTFLASFVEDYTSVSDANADADSITVWFSGSRDQAQIIRDMIDSDFTNKTNIKVNLSLVYQGFIQATLAGVGPDVALDNARGQPVNLACRGALLDMKQFDTYDEVMTRFAKGADIPYAYEGGVYGLPATQTYYMMFYRTDILNELGLNPPNTWDELYTMIPLLQRNNYNIGFPYTTITAQGAVDGGLGAKDLYTTLLLQKGGSLFTEDKSRSNLDTNEAVDAFKMWTEFYTKFGFPLEYNLNSRLRSGSIPLAVARYDMYNTFMAAAPEIRGLWAMAPVPGVLQDDGTIDRSVGASGTAHVIFKKAENPEACWDFLDWWTSTDVQYAYGNAIENLLGPAARFSTANVEAFDRLPWSKTDIDLLEEQRSFVKEVPEVPGSYIVSRSIDNAFRAVLYNGKNERERFGQETDTINGEIKRKRIEMGLE